MKSAKIHLGPRAFYVILFAAAALVAAVVIDGLVNTFSVDTLRAFLADRGYTEANGNVAVGEAAYRLTVIVRLVVNALVLVLFAVYSTVAKFKIRAGYVYTIFWSFVMVGNILGAWLIPGSDLPFKVVATFLSVVGMFGLFVHFIDMNQQRFYRSRVMRWGGDH